MIPQNTIGAVVIGGHKQALAIVRSLGEHGIPSVVIDNGPCLAQHSRYCVGFFRCASFQSGVLDRFLLDLAKREHIQGWCLFPTNDHMVMTIARHREELAQVYRISTPPTEIVELFYSKRRTIELAEREGVPVPRTWFAPFERLDEVSFPVLVKGIEGLTFYQQFGKKAFIAEDESSLQDILDNILQQGFPLGNVMIQKRIPNKRQKVVSCVYFAIEGDVKTRWAGEKIRSHPAYFGTATSAMSVHLPELLDTGARMVRATGYTGVCEVEFLYDVTDKRYKLLEINPRTWLWLRLAVKNGIDLPWYVYRYLTTGKPEAQYPQKYRLGVVWVSVLLELIFDAKGILHGEYDLRDTAFIIRDWCIGLIKLMRGKVVFGIFDSLDLKPSLMEILQFRSIYGRR